MVQFDKSEGECFVCGLVSISVIDIDSFHRAYFYICCPLFHFSSEFIPGWVWRFVKADLRRAAFPPPWAVNTKLSPADSI